MDQQTKLDSKDYEILRELDKDFRQNFSKIAKKVKLSKNSVSLRYKKLKDLMLHNLVGINNKVLGYTEVRIYCTFNYYDVETEKRLIDEIEKSQNIIWLARYYGQYDVCICFLVKDIDDFVTQMNRLNQKLSDKINIKHTQIACKNFYFRYNFIHKKPICTHYEICEKSQRKKINNSDKKILQQVKYDPRMHLIDIAEKTGMTIKTVSTRLKELEKEGIIMGYFMTLNITKFNHNTFKLLIRLNNLSQYKEFEKYLCSLKNIKYAIRMSGLWDYEVDFIFPTIRELQDQIDEIKMVFPNLLKEYSILSFGKRVYTNTKNFPI